MYPYAKAELKIKVFLFFFGSSLPEKNHQLSLCFSKMLTGDRIKRIGLADSYKKLCYVGRMKGSVTNCTRGAGNMSWDAVVSLAETFFVNHHR